MRSSVSVCEATSWGPSLADGLLGRRAKAGGTSRSSGRSLPCVGAQSRLSILVVSESSARLSKYGVGLPNKFLRSGLSKMLCPEKDVSIGDISSCGTKRWYDRRGGVVGP